MTQLSEKAERGADVIGSLMSPEFAEQIKQMVLAGGFGADIPRMALEYAFADAWGREGLPRREKSLVIIGALIALGQTLELKNHIKIGAHNGLSVKDFESILIQLAPYLGFPCVASASSAVVEALREVGMDPKVKTAEERGLL